MIIQSSPDNSSISSTFFQRMRSWRTWLLVVLLVLTTVAGVASAKKKKGKGKGKEGKGKDKAGKGKDGKRAGRKDIDLRKLSEAYDVEDPEEEEVWETKSEKKRRMKREARKRGAPLPPDGEKMDAAELQEMIKGASMGGGGMGGMMGGGMGGQASIKTMTAYLREGTCDGSLPPQVKEEPMEGKACAEKIMNRFSAVVATGGIPSVMNMAEDNSTILYVYSGLDKILQMGQMREFLLTRDEVVYVQQDTTRHWPDGRTAEFTTEELRAENQARKDKKGPTRKLKKKEVEKLKAAQEAAKERRQKMDKQRQLKRQAKDLEEVRCGWVCVWRGCSK